jgi:hypothetical protein
MHDAATEQFVPMAHQCEPSEPMVHVLPGA